MFSPVLILLVQNILTTRCTGIIILKNSGFNVRKRKIYLKNQFWIINYIIAHKYSSILTLDRFDYDCCNNGKRYPFFPRGLFNIYYEVQILFYMFEHKYHLLKLQMHTLKIVRSMLKPVMTYWICKIVFWLFSVSK